MKYDIDEMIRTLTLEEKARLMSGKDFWHTIDYEEKGIPAMMLSDGPHGLRRQAGQGDHLGMGQSEPATCYPSAAALANAWDVDLAREVGRALGDECLAQGVDVLLGPGMNIKRSPLCGRNFEYFSEDPMLTGALATAYVQGVQSRGVGCAPKHFAANNQETNRMMIDAQVEQRALREIYLAAFERVVKEANPWMLMSAYNRLNGAFCSENAWLLNDVLRGEWSFEGAVVSDWGAVDDRVADLRAGMDLEMPYTGEHNTERIIKAVQNESLPEETLNKAVAHLLRLSLRARESRRSGYKVDYAKHHALARKTAMESMVLLKNHDTVLPLRRQGSLAVIGAFASGIKYQGAGSSRVNPTHTENIFEELASIAGPHVGITHAQGYSFEEDAIDPAMAENALETAKQCESILVIAGIPDRVESEGFDRIDMQLPRNQNDVIRRLAALGKRMVVVLVGGAPVELPWLEQVDCVLAAYLGGQAVASALARVLYGDAVPCGKLAETWPVKLSHNPSYLNFPGHDGKVRYQEGVFVGYRYYATKGIAPLFPFGHGLSYTSFSYDNLRLDGLTVQVDVTNTGYCAGKEIVQLYVAPPSCGGIARPVRELRAFAKVELAPRETKTVSLPLDHRAFTYYDEANATWRVDDGEYTIEIGASSEDIRLQFSIHMEASPKTQAVFTPWSTLGEIAAHPNAATILGQMMGGQSPDVDAQSATFGVDAFELAKGMPLKKIIAMSGQDNPDAIVESLLAALNAAT